VSDGPAGVPAPPSVPDPAPPGEVRWQQVVGGWFLGLACVAVPAAATALVAGVLGLFDLETSVEPLLLVLAIGGPVVGYVVGFVVTLRRRRKGLAIGLALFGATVVLLSAACFVLVFANWGY